MKVIFQSATEVDLYWGNFALSTFNGGRCIENEETTRAIRWQCLQSTAFIWKKIVGKEKRPYTHAQYVRTRARTRTHALVICRRVEIWEISVMYSLQSVLHVKGVDQREIVQKAISGVSSVFVSKRIYVSIFIHTEIRINYHDKSFGLKLALKEN